MKYDRCLPPLQGWSRSGPTHGLRRGLHSFAALRLFATAILGHSRLGPISFSKLLRGSGTDVTALLGVRHQLHHLPLALPPARVI